MNLNDIDPNYLFQNLRISLVPRPLEILQNYTFVASFRYIERLSPNYNDNLNRKKLIFYFQWKRKDQRARCWSFTFRVHCSKFVEKATTSGVIDDSRTDCWWTAFSIVFYSTLSLRQSPRETRSGTGHWNRAATRTRLQFNTHKIIET